MAEKRKAPPGCFWRGHTLWGRFTVQGFSGLAYGQTMQRLLSGAGKQNATAR